MGGEEKKYIYIIKNKNIEKKNNLIIRGKRMFRGENWWGVVESERGGILECGGGCLRKVWDEGSGNKKVGVWFVGSLIVEWVRVGFEEGKVVGGFYMRVGGRE